MDREGIKKACGIIGCAVCWAVTVLLALAEVFCVYSWISGTLYVVKWGAEENPYAAEDAWAAGVFSLITAVPFLLMLALAVYCTIKLRKQGRKREYPVSDK